MKTSVEEAHILIPDGVEIPPIGANADNDRWTEAMVVLKFFTPDSGWTWYLSEFTNYGPGERIGFGLVCGFEKELGEFSIDELEECTGPMGLKIERDLHWKSKSLGEVMDAEGITWHRKGDSE